MVFVSDVKSKIMLYEFVCKNNTSLTVHDFFCQNSYQLSNNQGSTYHKSQCTIFAIYFFRKDCSNERLKLDQILFLHIYLKKFLRKKFSFLRVIFLIINTLIKYNSIVYLIC